MSIEGRKDNRSFNIPSEDDFATGVPSDNFTAQQVIPYGQEYTAPADGFYWAFADAVNNNLAYLGFIGRYTGLECGGTSCFHTGGTGGMWVMVAVHKGEKVGFGYANVANIKVYFIKSKTQTHIIKY